MAAGRPPLRYYRMQLLNGGGRGCGAVAFASVIAGRGPGPLGTRGGDTEPGRPRRAPPPRPDAIELAAGRAPWRP